MRRMCKSAWPHVYIRKVGEVYVARATHCNVQGIGRSFREAYYDWYKWYTMPY